MTRCLEKSQIRWEKGTTNNNGLKTTHQQLCRSEIVDDDGLGARDVDAHVAMHSTAFQADQDSEVHRQPLWIWDTSETVFTIILLQEIFHQDCSNVKKFLKFPR